METLFDFIFHLFLSHTVCVPIQGNVCLDVGKKQCSSPVSFSCVRATGDIFLKIVMYAWFNLERAWRSVEVGLV